MGTIHGNQIKMITSKTAMTRNVRRGGKISTISLSVRLGLRFKIMILKCVI